MSHLRSTSSNTQPPRLLDQVRSLAMARFGRPEPGERFAEWIKRYVLSPRTEECYATWVERFIRFHGMRHPRDMGAEVET